jgi:hypothetical protein
MPVTHEVPAQILFPLPPGNLPSDFLQVFHLCSFYRFRLRLCFFSTLSLVYKYQSFTPLLGFLRLLTIKSEKESICSLILNT